MKRWLAAILAVLIVASQSPARAGALAFALLVAWVIVVLVRPHRKCTWCGGTRRAPRYRLFGKVGRCPKCKARAVHKRLGAVMVHRMFWAVAGDRWMERRRAAQAEDKELIPDGRRNRGGGPAVPGIPPGSRTHAPPLSEGQRP